MEQWSNQKPAYTQPRGEISNPGLSARRGPAGWWLNLTAPPKPQQILGVSARERMRKAELTSYSILAVFAFLLTLVSNSLADPATAQAVIIMAIGLFIAAILNRAGKTRAAAYLVPILLMALITLAIVGAVGLDALLLPAYDLYALPIIISSLTIGRRAPWFLGLVAIAIIVADFLFQPHLLITATTPPNGSATNFDTIAYYTSIFNIWGMVNRHVGLMFFASLVSWLGARSVESAITRADRAEELAELERRELERTHELEEGVRQLLAVHVHLANGDFNVRAPAIRNTLLWQIGSSLNNLVARLGRMAQADFVLRRTQEEANRLVEALYALRSGRSPIWPPLSQTPLDRLVEEMRVFFGAHGGAGGAGGAGAANAPSQLPTSPQQLPPAGMAGYRRPPAIQGAPERPSSVYPGSPGGSVGSASQQGPSQVPDWVQTLMSDSGNPNAPAAPPSAGHGGQMPSQWPAYGNTPPGGAENPATGYGAGVPPSGQEYPAPASASPASPDVNPWSFSPSEPVDERDLPEWLRSSNQE